MHPAFETIYEAHKDMVYNLCLHYVHRTEDAEELTQDVFIKVFQKLEGFREDAQLKTWIYRITIHVCLDFIKAQKRQKRFGFMTGLFSSTTGEERAELIHGHHPGLQLEQQERLGQLLKWIKELPATQQTALILMKIEGMTQKEAAYTMKISTKALESLIQRAKKNLKNKIENET
jgi:RNA polymerase sigma-70 factor (ECF subfamily)